MSSETILESNNCYIKMSRIEKNMGPEHGDPRIAMGIGLDIKAVKATT